MRSLLLIVGVCQTLIVQSQMLWDQIPAGPHDVCLKEIGLVDDSRPFGELNERPMQVVMWYPAELSEEARRMTVEDYFQLEFREVDFESMVTDDMRSKMLKKLTRHGADSSKLDELLESNTKAIVDAKPKEGKYPVILFVQGGGRPARSAFMLSEFLASYGFVVVTFPHIGSETQRPDPGLKRYLTQVDDIKYVVSEMETQSFIDTDQLFLFSFSTAAESLFIYQSQHGKAKAIVTLDGTPDQELLSQVSGFDQNKIEIPLLFIKSNHGAGMTIEQAKEENDLQSVFPESKKSSVRMMKMNHPDLLTIGLMEAFVPKLTRFEPLGEKVKSHIVLYGAILNFLKDVGGGLNFNSYPEELAVIKLYNSN